MNKPPVITLIDGDVRRPPRPNKVVRLLRALWRKLLSLIYSISPQSPPSTAVCDTQTHQPHAQALAAAPHTMDAKPMLQAADGGAKSRKGHKSLSHRLFRPLVDATHCSRVPKDPWYLKPSIKRRLFEIIESDEELETGPLTGGPEPQMAAGCAPHAARGGGEDFDDDKTGLGGEGSGEQHQHQHRHHLRKVSTLTCGRTSTGTSMPDENGSVGTSQDTAQTLPDESSSSFSYPHPDNVDPGYETWLKIRSQWTGGLHEHTTTPEEFVNFADSKLKGIPESSYPGIYKVLVKDNRPLKEPLNLVDAIKVMKAGWISDGTWPEGN
uniref:ARAD1A16412p n=1 Tax=Blastobotrys adeninivorans TaxID=409370 RepID=A0A060SZ19_BLAAD